MVTVVDTEKGYLGVSYIQLIPVLIEAIKEQQIIIDKPIKELGLHTILVSLHPESQCNIALNVARSVEEAALQSDGKSIQDLAAQAEAEADFEIAELFDDMGTAALEELEELEEKETEEKSE